jgi:protein phosphatase
MPSHPDPNPARPAGRPPPFARPDEPAGPDGADVLPAWDAPPAVPVALPVAGVPDAGEIPVALPVPAPEPGADPVVLPVAEAPGDGPAGDEGHPPEARPGGAPGDEAATESEIILPAAEPALAPCPVCGSARPPAQESCPDCGYYFAPEGPAARAAPDGSNSGPAPGTRLQGGRFELGERTFERGGVSRYRGLDHGDGSGPPVPVVIVRQEAAAPPPAAPAAPGPPPEESEDILPVFDTDPDATAPPTEVLPPAPGWPGVAWERGLLRAVEGPAWPQIVAAFTEGGADYLVEEAPQGRPLWDAWDDPGSAAADRFGWLAQVAEAVRSLHFARATLEGLRPELVVVTPEGQARFADVADLLPLPVPPGTPLRDLLYTAPELRAGRGQADARADLYSFGALLYALHVGRELAEIDFDGPGQPKPFLPRFPDVHPAFGRLISKTFRREVAARFPSDEAAKEDPSGFLELTRTLRVLGRTADNVRLEIAAWTTTGMVRTGNEDAFALLHACESRQDDIGEAVLVLLADGMGGYEAGEVAAALAIQALRGYLVSREEFAALAGASAFPADALAGAGHEGHAAGPLDLGACQQLLREGIREANRQVFAAARAPGAKRRGMGCTLEAVYVDGRNVVVAHVGDSRTYHLHEGRLLRLTRDQTLVNRLVELGTLSEEEAATHPRRNELQQAVGGQPEVDPAVSAGPLSPGDWVLVCSDGLTNHVTDRDLLQMLQSEATSAEMAARRLVNLANIEGATDNATVVVIRAT